jgi:LysR family transcriptional activator of glutamate synthase operon
MDIKQIEYFVAVVETGSFSSAAEELYISQSSLSKQIIALEKELGVKLFDRSKRRIALTEAGKMFHKHALSFKKINQSLLSDLGEYRKSTPSLAIAAIPVTAQYGITSYIAQFKKAYPLINFTMEERQASTVLPALSQHKYDLAFIRDYNVNSNEFSFFPIVIDRLIVAVASDHLFAKRKSIALKELSDENFIMFNKGTLIHELSMNACQSAGFEPKVFYTASRASSIIGMLTSNSGVALIMEKVLNYYNRSDVTAIPLDQTIESKIIIAYSKNRKLSKPAKTFLDFMQKSVVE